MMPREYNSDVKKYMNDVKTYEKRYQRLKELIIQYTTANF